ncbi:MAG: hypothetical protein MR540_02910 [Clostridiales bacterium]|nr:hypothetical protein [Clostridiales bacterium]
MPDCAAPAAAGCAALHAHRLRCTGCGRRRITPFGAMLCTAVAASMIACNQTLSILLTHQLCADTEPDGPSCAIDLENSVVVLAPLVPWSIAGAVPLASAGAPEQSLLAACYL